MDTNKQTELKKRREARVAKEKEATAQRDLDDLEALDALEETHGIANIRRIDLPTAAPLPGFAVIRAPDPAEYKAWQAVVMKGAAKSSEKAVAAEDLATDVLLYPDIDTYKKLVEKHAGVPTLLASEAVKFAGGAAHDSGKE